MTSGRSSPSIPHICPFWYTTILFRFVKKIHQNCVNSRKNSKNGPKLRFFYAKKYTSSKKYTTASCVVVTNMSYVTNKEIVRIKNEPFAIKMSIWHPTPKVDIEFLKKMTQIFPTRWWPILDQYALFWKIGKERKLGKLAASSSPMSRLADSVGQDQWQMTGHHQEGESPDLPFALWDQDVNLFFNPKFSIWLEKDVQAQ